MHSAGGGTAWQCLQTARKTLRFHITVLCDPTELSCRTPVLAGQNGRTLANSSRSITLSLLMSNWENRLRMATRPDDTRSINLVLPSAVTCRTCERQLALCGAACFRYFYPGHHRSVSAQMSQSALAGG